MSLSLPEKIVAIHKRLKQAHISHAFGGALALAYYAEPRATIDIDLNLFVTTDRYGDARNALDPLGVSGDVDPERLHEDGQCRLWWEDTPLDLFFAYDQIHEAMRGSLRRVPFASESKLPVLAPEYLVICKIAFDRPKDWLDIEQMMICVENLDVDEIRSWLERIYSEGDSRIRKFEELRKSLY